MFVVCFTLLDVCAGVSLRDVCVTKCLVPCEVRTMTMFVLMTKMFWHEVYDRRRRATTTRTSDVIVYMVRMHATCEMC